MWWQRWQTWTLCGWRTTESRSSKTDDIRVSSKPPALPAAKSKTAWQKVAKVGFLLYQKAGQRLTTTAHSVLNKLDAEFKVTGMAKEIRGVVDRVLNVKGQIDRQVSRIQSRVHSTLDNWTAKLGKSADVRPSAQKPEKEQNREASLAMDMSNLQALITTIRAIDESLKLVNKVVDKLDVFEESEKVKPSK